MNRKLLLGLALGTTLALAGDPLLGQGGTDCCQVLAVFLAKALGLHWPY
ncbi:MAG: hypothetical protein WEB59_15600 [Thermoanaerobaculia bacterium]